jgi:hypothetical protein
VVSAFKFRGAIAVGFLIGIVAAIIREDGTKNYCGVYRGASQFFAGAAPGTGTNPVEI